MRRTIGRNANMRFLFGSVFFFFVIIVTIGFFAYFSLYKYWNEPGSARFSYEISFSKAFENTSYRLFVNDSLVYAGAPVDADTVVRFNRFAQENALLVVDDATDGVSIFQLPDRGNVCLGITDGLVTAEINE